MSIILIGLAGFINGGIKDSQRFLPPPGRREVVPAVATEKESSGLSSLPRVCMEDSFTADGVISDIFPPNPDDK